VIAAPHLLQPRRIGVASESPCRHLARLRTKGYADPVLLYLAGWIVLMAAFAIAQARFYEAHRRVHGHWRPAAEAMRTTLFHTPVEIRQMLRATFRKDPDQGVETARGQYLTVLAIAAVYLILAIPVAIWTGPA
jgi:hypothetical protein